MVFTRNLETRMHLNYMDLYIVIMEIASKIWVGNFRSGWVETE